MLNGFGTIVNAMGQKVKPYFPQINDEVVAWQHNLPKKQQKMSKFNLFSNYKLANNIIYLRIKNSTKKIVSNFAYIKSNDN
jgi:hypothetical protein